MILKYKNIPVFYEDVGEGEPIVLLHGFLENAAMWHDIKKDLIQTNRVISVDLLGHGKTGCIGYIHKMSDMANAVLSVLEHLDVKEYNLIGHSMGGYVSLDMAERYPKAVNRLCLINSTYKADDEERRMVRQRANKMVQSNYEAVVKMSFINLFSSESRKTHASELEKALFQALKTPLQGYIAAQEGMMVRTDKYELLKALDAKKIIIVGKKDPVVDANRILKETIGTNIVCKQLPDGHMSHIENKSELSYIIKHFIE
ncbi:alpha/beta fold hydrolase [Psychroserpens luteolus]|uniref:alpha/beta fold hydrolase n=1 Tax=Psychroserpens luteolus TaxID=2855840 RepID=UPI001E28A29A|nr:alpha/beta hydrolase [Psychroserpens luteolus]MCD2258438.1 alpha/beta hydrolase [Psychroserpens luteolus]